MPPSLPTSLRPHLNSYSSISPRDQPREVSTRTSIPTVVRLTAFQCQPIRVSLRRDRASPVKQGEHQGYIDVLSLHRQSLPTEAFSEAHILPRDPKTGFVEQDGGSLPRAFSSASPLPGNIWGRSSNSRVIWRSHSGPSNDANSCSIGFRHTTSLSIWRLMSSWAKCIVGAFFQFQDPFCLLNGNPEPQRSDVMTQQV
jgi:hypothetical protein